jgi:phenylalanyl-tRNA synthetase beta chain
MIVPLNWLKDYIDLSESPQEIATAFTSIGYMLDRPIQGEGDAAVLDLEVRQNRSDCLSLVGLARELGAVMERPIKMPEIVENFGPHNSTTHIDIPDPELCYRFHAITIEDVHISDSPDWIKDRLASYGIKTVNVIVDITNYVSIELGMPMHAYDADKIVDRTISIRAAQKGETLKVLGGKEVVFDEDDMIHADPSGPIGFGALIGGEEKSVHNDTKNIILEAAVYNNASVRRSSRRHSIRTEASTRLEKFLHPDLVEVALKRAIKLMQDLAGGTIIDNTDNYPRPQEIKKIQLDLHEIKRLGGIDISDQDAIDILARLEIPTEKHAHILEASVPFFRTDLEQEADLVEEVIRIHGYDKIPEQLPHTAPPTNIQSPQFDLEEKTRDIMIALGYDEVITDPLTLETSPVKDPIKLENSLTAEKTMLRTTMQYSMVTALEHRKKFRAKDIRLFEIGKIYYREGDEYVEQRVLGGITFGPHTYLDTKGDLEALMRRLGYEPDEKFIALEALSSSTFYFSLNIDDLYANMETYPSVSPSAPPQLIFHDFSVSVARDEHVGSLLHEIKKLDSRIYSATLGEEPRLNHETKTLYIKVSYNDPEKTLSEEDVKPIREKILQFVESKA